MPGGKIHDNPVTDLIIHGLHPFPPDIEMLILELIEKDQDSKIFNALKWAPFDWEAGKYLDESRELLDSLIINYQDFDECIRLIAEYENKTEHQ